MNIAGILNKKNLILTVAGLFFMPFFSYAQIPVDNPGGMFADIDFLGVVENVADFVISFIAILGIIFLVYGAILYVSSGGDETRAEEGKSTITYAIIGLFLAAMAFAIEKLILETLVS